MPANSTRNRLSSLASKAALFEAIDNLFTHWLANGGRPPVNESRLFYLNDAVWIYLGGLESREVRIITSEFARDHFLSDRAVEMGMGVAEVIAFGDWLKAMGLSVAAV